MEAPITADSNYNFDRNQATAHLLPQSKDNSFMNVQVQ
jgi:hypothetical protein